MARNGLIVATALILASVASMPSTALAQRSRNVVGAASGGTVAPHSGRAVVGGGGRVVIGGGRPIVTPPIVVPPHFGHHRFFPKRFFPKPFFPFAVVAAAPIYYPPPVYYPPPAYYPPPYYDSASYTAPVSYAPTASPTVSVTPQRPQPDVVQFATGRYELRGDGVSTPYTWVWIPNPPTAPPPAAPTAPPSEAPPAEGPSASKRQPAPRASQLYRWVDPQGVVYWTDRLDAVPEEYRSRVKQITPS